MTTKRYRSEKQLAAVPKLYSLAAIFFVW